MIATPSNPETSSLRLRGLRFAYGCGPLVHADVDLDVAAGEVHCVLGPSGCGKTTLLRLVSGLERVAAGTIEVGGRIVADARTHVPPERRRVGIVFQDFALFPNLSVRRNVMFGLRGGRRRMRRAAAERLLDRVGMLGCADRMPHTLSGGQQQRVALARALAAGPEVMLLDEPFSSLDAGLRARLRGDLLGVLRGAGVATLMVTHDPAEAAAVGDRSTWLGGETACRAGATPVDPVTSLPVIETPGGSDVPCPRDRIPAATATRA